jgi:rhodanese-related sulfurtransferase
MKGLFRNPVVARALETTGWLLRFENLFSLALWTMGIILVASIAGLLFNLVNPRGIPLVSRQPYDIYVACPKEDEAAGIKKMSAKELNQMRIGGVVIIDARGREQYREGHLPGAISLPHDPLACPDRATVEILKAKGQVVVVYGDAKSGNGISLARELHREGVPMMAHLEGGFAAWVNAGMLVKKEEK